MMTIYYFYCIMIILYMLVVVLGEVYDRERMPGKELTPLKISPLQHIDVLVS